MNEAQAKQWLIHELNVSRETIAMLEQFILFLREEAAKQNLISAATLDQIWARHIVDSAQLLTLLPPGGTANDAPNDAPNDASRDWLDLGSGAGFPGLIAAMLSNHRVTLVESRGIRAEYLRRAVHLFGLEQKVTVAAISLAKLESRYFSIISARAFAPLPRLLADASRFSTENTCWLLPKGKNAVKEMESVAGIWAHDFRIVNSVTDADSGILLGNLRGRLDSGPQIVGAAPAKGKT